ncbi:MAG: DUF4358 domain-containing protein [Oscillospiraceae bacterium]|nr:DUF4358 domain-containing protein [Oscillospiraceae bacterium]
MKRILSLCAMAALCLSLLSACGGGGAGGGGTPAEDKKVDLAAFAQALPDTHEFGGFLQRVDADDPDMGEMMAQMLENYYPGLAAMDLEQLEVYMSMISFSSGEFAVAQAKDAAGAAKVKEIFQARIDAKTTDGPGNYPEEVELWQHNAALAENGNYVMLVCCEDSEAIVSEFNALFQ